MSARTVVHCNTVWGYSSCPSSLMTDALTAVEARQIADAYGWRHSGGRDYCPGCSGSTVRPRVIVAVPDEAPAPKVSPAERLQLAHDIVNAAVAGATAGPWCRRRPTGGMPEGITGVEYVTGGMHAADCVARTGPVGNAIAAGDATYIALMDPEVGRAVCGILRDACEEVQANGGRVETSSPQAAVDLADALLRPRDERFVR